MTSHRQGLNTGQSSVQSVDEKLTLAVPPHNAHFFLQQTALTQNSNTLGHTNFLGTSNLPITCQLTTYCPPHIYFATQKDHHVFHKLQHLKYIRVQPIIILELKIIFAARLVAVPCCPCKQKTCQLVELPSACGGKSCHNTTSHKLIQSHTN